MSFASLFCHQGRDNGLRALAIQLSCLVFVLLIALLFSNSVVTLIAAAIALPICALSSLRRLKDAAKPNTLLAIPVLMLLLFSMSLSFSFPAAVSIIVFILGAVTACGFAWIAAPKTNQRKPAYVMGYFGPHAKVGAKRGDVRRRQEPVMGGGQGFTANDPVNDQHDYDHEHGFDNDSGYLESEFEQGSEPGYQQETVYKEDTEASQQSHNINDESGYESDDKPTYRVDRGALESGSLSELLKSWFNWAQSNQKVLLMVAKGAGVVTVIATLIYLISLLFSNNDLEQAPVDIAPIAQPETINESARVKLPDGFWLILQKETLVLRWLGDEGDAQSIWRLDTAEGDKRCAELVFNDGSQFRPMQVDLMADSGTEARFSPLDNNKIINNIAMRGSFKLCGYNFSLKGSQAALTSQPDFARYLKSL